MERDFNHRRPFTAPTTSLTESNDSIDLIAKILVAKDVELSAWGDGKSRAKSPHKRSSDVKKTRDSKTAPVFSTNSRKYSSRGRKSNSNAASSVKGKANKWYLKAMKDSQLDIVYPFQHYTDTSRYMSEYRTIKMEKTQQAYPQEIQSTNFPPEIHAQEPIMRSSNNHFLGDTAMVYLQSPVEREEFPISYRLEGRDDSKRTQESPIKMRGKCVDSKEEKIKEKGKYQRRQPGYLPKCDAITIPSRGDLYMDTDDSFIPNHVKQCRKLSELSIQKAPQSALRHQRNALHNMSPTYRTQNERVSRNLNLGSAEERRRTQVSPVVVKPPGYNRIIKRVLEHYDPSKNQVRSRMSSHVVNSAKVY